MDTLAAHRADLANLPVIDLVRLEDGDPVVRAEEARALRAACTGLGFFYLKGHRVPLEVSAAAFDQARAFFDLPVEAKMALDLRRSPVLRGFTPLLAENADVAAHGDLHEAFDMGGVLYDGTPGARFNRFPEALPNMEGALAAYRDEMLRLARTLMSGFALALNLAEDHFTPVLTDPQAFLRLLHYPPQAGEIDPAQIGIGAHSDYESLTILAQDSHRALQVANGAGGWIWAEPIPWTLVVNIGDQMARWTNDLFRSTVHRAINQTGERRYSIPFFFGPDPNALISTLPGCADEDRPARYAPIRAGDYSRDRAMASYPGSSRALVFGDVVKRP